MSEVDPSERIARYLLQKRGMFSIEKSTVHRRAFMPQENKRTGRFETSVYRTSTLSNDEVALLGRYHVAEPRDKKLYGWAELSCYFVRQAGLCLEADDKPRHHANVIGWPDEKSQRMSIAQKLADSATLVLIPAEKRD